LSSIFLAYHHCFFESCVTTTGKAWQFFLRHSERFFYVIAHEDEKMPLMAFFTANGADLFV